MNLQEAAEPSSRLITLIAVHGNGGGAHRFARVAPHTPPDVSLVAVTLPGFADVPADPALRSIADYAVCLASIVSDQPRPRIVLGHGIGGSIALELVQLQADLLDGLILHAPVGTRLERRLFPRLMAIPGARSLGKRLFASRLFRPLYRRLLFSRTVPPAYLDRFFEEYRACSVFNQMFDLITPAWFRRLRPTDLPSGLLWGKAERLLTVDQIDDYRALLPRAVVRRVPCWGHFPMIDRPAEYAAEIAALSRSLASPDGSPALDRQIHVGSGRYTSASADTCRLRQMHVGFGRYMSAPPLPRTGEDVDEVDICAAQRGGG